MSQSANLGARCDSLPSTKHLLYSSDFTFVLPNILLWISSQLWVFLHMLVCARWSGSMRLPCFPSMVTMKRSCRLGGFCGNEWAAARGGKAETAGPVSPHKRSSSTQGSAEEKIFPAPHTCLLCTHPHLAAEVSFLDFFCFFLLCGVFSPAWICSALSSHFCLYSKAFTILPWMLCSGVLELSSDKSRAGS